MEPVLNGTEVVLKRRIIVVYSDTFSKKKLLEKWMKPFGTVCLNSCNKTLPIEKLDGMILPISLRL
jgi:hypothetical protein